MIGFLEAGVFTLFLGKCLDDTHTADVFTHNRIHTVQLFLQAHEHRVSLPDSPDDFKQYQDNRNRQDCTEIEIQRQQEPRACYQEDKGAHAAAHHVGKHQLHLCDI